MRKAYLLWLGIAAALTLTLFLLWQHKRAEKHMLSWSPAKASPTAWYKNSIFYNLDVKVFQDSDGNGVSMGVLLAKNGDK
jgi:hypothetical protein